MPAHPERIRNPFPSVEKVQRWTARCFSCDTFFEARTCEAADSLLRSHQAREQHQQIPGGLLETMEAL